MNRDALLELLRRVLVWNDQAQLIKDIVGCQYQFDPGHFSERQHQGLRTLAMARAVSRDFNVVARLTLRESMQSLFCYNGSPAKKLTLFVMSMLAYRDSLLAQRHLFRFSVLAVQEYLEIALRDDLDSHAYNKIVTVSSIVMDSFFFVMQTHPEDSIVYEQCRLLIYCYARNGLLDFQQFCRVNPLIPIVKMLCKHIQPNFKFQSVDRIPDSVFAAMIYWKRWHMAQNFDDWTPQSIASIRSLHMDVNVFSLTPIVVRLLDLMQYVDSLSHEIYDLNFYFGNGDLADAFTVSA